MGAGMFNIYGERHWQDVSPPTIEMRDHVHRGDSEIDTLSPWFSPARGAAHRTAAAISQAAFDAAYDVTASTWYALLTTASKDALRRSYL